jgi:uncharacterized protein
VAVLGNEYIQVIAKEDQQVRSLIDLKGKRVWMSTPGSGVYFTADQLNQKTELGMIPETQNLRLSAAFKSLDTGKIAAIIYIGKIGANQTLRNAFDHDPKLRLIAIPREIVNYLTIRDVSVYEPGMIPKGTYNYRPAVPDRDISVISTATVLLTRPDVSKQTVSLMTWSLLSMPQEFMLYYPELRTGQARSLFRRGLSYIHPAAYEVYEKGDPRDAWLRYWLENSDFLAGLVLTLPGLLIFAGGAWWQRQHRQRTRQFTRTTLKRIQELEQLLPDQAQDALNGAEELSHELRVMFFEDNIPSHLYEQLRLQTATFGDRCRDMLKNQRQQTHSEIIDLLNELQILKSLDPAIAQTHLHQIQQRYLQLLSADSRDTHPDLDMLGITLTSMMTSLQKSIPNPLDPLPE